MSAPVKYTCPDIDTIVKPLYQTIRDIDKMKYHEYEDAEYMEDYLSNCRSLMDDAIDTFERLRSSNNELRTWGTEMEEEAENMSVKYSELEEKYNQLLNDLNQAEQ
jgi:predicted nuclease with TOPRIM domain